MNISFCEPFPSDPWVRRLYQDIFDQAGGTRKGKMIFLTIGIAFGGWFAWDFYYNDYFSLILLIACLYFLLNALIKKKIQVNKAMKLMRESPDYKKDIDVEITEELMRFSSVSGTSTTTTWASISDSFEGKDYFYFKAGDVVVADLDKRAMTAVQLHELKNWITSQGKWGKGGSMRRA
ncbi:MAG: hypothetical protein RRY13_06700 [Akkermansia sp.]